MTHHQKAHWPAIVFAVLAIGAMVAILALGAEETSNTKDTTNSGQPTAEPPEYFCDQAIPTEFELSDVEGKTFDDAEEWAEANNFTIRPTAIDGEQLAQTQDYRTDRINVQVDDDIVTRYCGNY